MRHVTAEAITNYTDGRLSDTEKLAFETHLTSCKDCSELKQEMQSLLVRLTKDAAFEPPDELLNWGIHLFQPIMKPEPSGLPRFIASLVFDTFEQPMFAGVRRVGAPPRQLLFRAGEVDVDVKIESMEANDRITLAGQVLSSGAKFFDNTPVKLESHG